MSAFVRTPFVGTESRRNCIPNPSGAVNVTGYTAVGGGATLGTTGVGTPGAYSIAQTATAGIGITGFGVLVTTFTIGTDLAANTEYTFTAEVTASVGATPKSAVLFAAGSGAVATVSEAFPAVGGLPRRTITFTTAASGTIDVAILNGDLTVTGTNEIAYRWMNVERSGTYDSAAAYFDGGTPDSATTRHDWVGTPNSSASIEYSPGGADIIEPIIVFGPFENAREVRNISRELLHDSDVRSTFVPTVERTGEYQLLFETYADAREAADKFTAASLFAYSGPDAGGTPAHLAVDGGYIIEVPATSGWGTPEYLETDGGYVVEVPGTPATPDASFAATFIVWGGSLAITQNGLWELRVPYKEVTA